MNKVVKDILKWASLVLGVAAVFALFLPAVTVAVGDGGDVSLNWNFNAVEIVFGGNREIRHFPPFNNGQEPIIMEMFTFNFPLFLSLLLPLVGGAFSFAEGKNRAFGWVSVALFGLGALLSALSVVLIPAGYGTFLKNALDLTGTVVATLSVTASLFWLLPLICSLVGGGCALAVRIDERKGVEK